MTFIKFIFKNTKNMRSFSSFEILSNVLNTKLNELLIEKKTLRK